MNVDVVPVPLMLPLPDRLWFFEIVVGILVLVAVNVLFRRLMRHVRRRSISVASPDWREKIDQIFSLPFQILLWLLGGTLIIEVLGRRFGFAFFEGYIDAFRSSGFIACIAWILLRWCGVAQKEFLNRDRNAYRLDPGVVLVIGKTVSVLIILITLMIVLQIWGLNIGPLIAFGGIGAAAIGFSAKDVLANFFGGFMLHLNRPFVIGDTIQLPSQHLKGVVEAIGWNITTVRDDNKRPVYLPNATFSEVLVINDSRMTHRLVEEEIGIRYEDFDKLAALVGQIKSAISAHPDVDTHLPVLVVFDGFGGHALNIYLEVYILQTRYEKFLHVRQEILLLAYEQMRKAGAEIAGPFVQGVLVKKPQVF